MRWQHKTEIVCHNYVRQALVDHEAEGYLLASMLRVGEEIALVFARLVEDEAPSELEDSESEVIEDVIGELQDAIGLLKESPANRYTVLEDLKILTQRLIVWQCREELSE